MAARFAILNWKGGSGKTTTALALAVGLGRRLPGGSGSCWSTATPRPTPRSSCWRAGHPRYRRSPTSSWATPSRPRRSGRPGRTGSTSSRPTGAWRMPRCSSPTSSAGATPAGGPPVGGGHLRRGRGQQPAAVVAPDRERPGGRYEVLVAIDPGMFAIAGLGKLQETVERVRHHLEHPVLAIVGLLLTRVTKNRVAKDLSSTQGCLRPARHRAVIPQSVKVEEAHARHRSICEWAPGSAVGMAYDELVTEVLNNGQSKSRVARKRGPRSGDAA